VQLHGHRRRGEGGSGGGRHGWGTPERRRRVALNRTPKLLPSGPSFIYAQILDY
jgi:hypothetical protein